MIVYSLSCKNDHTFEAWFKDSNACDEQVADAKIACPVCGSKKIEKALMAPNVATSRKAEAAAKKQMMATGEALKMLGEIRRQVEENCDYVGENFAEEARKIHYGETEKRDIYGEATKDEATKLKDEGVEVQQIPWLPNQDS
jgi:hypothetical protein